MAKKETLGAYLNRNIKELGSTLSKEKAKGKKYKSIAAAKKAGALYYTNKAGKIMAAVYGEDLKVRPAASELMNSGIKVTKLNARNGADSPGKGSDGAMTYEGGAAAQKRGANTPNKRGPQPQRPAPDKAPKLKDGIKEEVQANKGGMMMKKKKTGYAAGGMPMVMKAGKKVPAFAADGKGKMNKGGMAVAKKKPAAKKMMAGGMATKKKPAAKKMMAGGMTKKSGYMYGGMAKKKMKK